jgi:branched-chain amino acid transport system permease protein
VIAVHTFLQAAILGVLTGGVYALMSTGQTLVFGVMRVVNVAQGVLVILAAYLSYTVHDKLGIDPFATIVIVMPAMFAVGVLIQLLFIRPVKRNRTGVSFEQTLLIMFALAVGIEGILDLAYTSEYRSITTSYANSSWTVLGYTVSVVRVLAFALAVVLLAALWALLDKTSFGRAVRATVQNPTSARLLGVDTERIEVLGMGLGICLAGAAGAVYGLIYPFNANSSYDLVSRLLSIIVLGGLGSVVGAVVGSLMLGVTEAVVAATISPVWAPFTFLVVLMVVLLVRPRGLFGVAERGAL